MKAVIEILKNYYNSVENAKRSREFFFSLADYSNHLKSTPELQKIIQELAKEKNELLKEWEEYENKATQELKEAKQKILKIIKKNKISSPELNEALEELTLYETGKILSSGISSDNLEDYLWDISKAVFQAGHKDFLKKFIEEKPATPNIYIDDKNFLFSKTIKKRRVIDNRIVELRNTELWGCWDYLSLVPIILLEHKQFHEVISEKDLGMANIFISLREIFKIRGCIKNEIYGILPPQIPPEEAREMLKYKLYASRIHNHLLKELNLRIKPRYEQPIELYKEPLIKEKTWGEFEKEMQEGMKIDREHQHQEKMQIRQLKQNRILASKADKYSHALDLIIERAEIRGNGKDLIIDYYYFNFEDRMDDLMVLTHYLEKLKENKCFESSEKRNRSGGTDIIFIKVDIENLKKFKEKQEEKSLPSDKKKQTKETVFCLNQNGELYQEPKNKRCYSMDAKSNRHKIIDFLAKNRGYQSTGLIARELLIESEKTIRTEIGKIKNNIEKHFKGKKDFLQGKKESCYRINPKYKVIIKNE